MVAQQYRTVAEPGAGNADAFFGLLVLKGVEAIETDIGDLHLKGLLHGLRRADASNAGAAGWLNLALDPGQAGAAPASYMIALPAGVLVALEALEHVVAVGIARFEGESGTPSERRRCDTGKHERFLVDLMGQLRDKAGIRLAAGVGLPFDFDGVRNAPDPVQLGARAHIDEFGAGREFEDLERLGGRERPRIRANPCRWRDGAPARRSFNFPMARVRLE